MIGTVFDPYFMIVAILAGGGGRVRAVWDEELWGAPPADRPAPRGPETPDAGWAPEVRPPGPQSTRAKVTVVAVAIGLVVGTVILCCAALNALAGLYFLDLDPIQLL